MGTTRFGSLSTAATMTVGSALVIGGTTAGALLFSNQSPVISGTGSDGVTAIVYEKHDRVPLTATGGSATYQTLNYSHSLTGTGLLLDFCLEITTPIDAMSLDCGVVGKTATTTGEYLFNNLLLKAGVHCIHPVSASGVTISPNQKIKCAALTGTGKGLVGDAYVKLRETILK